MLVVQLLLLVRTATHPPAGIRVGAGVELPEHAGCAVHRHDDGHREHEEADVHEGSSEVVQDVATLLRVPATDET